MSKSNNFENSILALIFNGTPIANLADNAASSPLTNLYLSLHTADPGEGGSQSTNEVTYTSYARVAVIRTSAGFTVAGGVVTPLANVLFPSGTGGGGTATHAGIGTAASGAGVLLYSGAISPAIVCGTGIAPILTSSSTITED